MRQPIAPQRIQRRPALASDEDFLFRLYMDMRQPEFAPLGLPPEQLRMLLASQYQIRQRGYAATYPDLHEEVLLVDDEPVGAMMWCSQPDDLRLVNITILADSRGRGIGSWALDQLMADAANTSFSLMVRHENPALQLYLRKQMTIVGQDELHLHLRK